MNELAGYERDGDVILRAEDRGWLEPLGLTNLERVFALDGVPRSRGRSLVQLPAPDGVHCRNHTSAVVFVKRWDFNRAEMWLRGAVKLNFPAWSGPGELENLLALRAAGLPVPLPFAAGERDEGARRRSFIALAQLPGRPLDALPPPPTPAGRRARVRDLAALVRALHEAGFWHKDLYLCNVFLDPAAEGPGLGLLDCDRVDRAPGGPPLRWRVKDLAALDYSAGWPTQAERLRFLRAYLAAPRLEEAGHRLARAVRRKARRMAGQGDKTA